MPRRAQHILSWSPDQARYMFSIQGQLEQTFAPEDTDAWQAWLETVTSFAFQGKSGYLNIYRETRRGTHRYWYAYATVENRPYKRYLGQATSVTFAQLEAVAFALKHPIPAPNASVEPGASSQYPRTPFSEQELTNEQDIKPDPHLPFTRFVPPFLPPEQVNRERLLTRLDIAQTHRLTLLSASAGWGKTTLLSQWAARAHFPVAWLSLDALDNDLTRFWTSALAALRYSRAYPPQVGEQSLEMLHSSQIICVETILTTFLEELHGQQTPVFLLLDDYHVIEEQAIHNSLLFLLEHLPVHLHLMMASRIDPPLTLARLRSRGTLLELRDADLRFQEEEASQFLTRTMALPLEPAEIAQLTRRTEGWITGLHLAALALPRYQDHAAFVRGFTGSHRYLLDYVQEDILARIAQPLQDFLLQSAILQRMSAALCQVVAEQADLQTSQQMLEALERTNLFLVPLDEERRWYRLHDLFREALLARLHATRPELVPMLHRRAASFYELRGEWSEAITHRLAARDYVSAVDLMERTVEHFWLRGETATLFHWIAILPYEVIRAHANFVLKIAGHLLLVSIYTTKEQLAPGRAQVERLLVRVEEATLWMGEGQQDYLRLLRQRLVLVRLRGEAFELYIENDLTRCSALLQQVMQMDQDEDLFWQVISLSFAYSYHFALRQEGAVLVPRLLETRQQISQSGDHFALVKVKQWLALASIRSGQLRQVHQESLEALALLEHIQGYALLRGYFLLCLAIVFYEQNQLGEARTLLCQVIADALTWQQADQMLWGYELLAGLEIAAGDLLAAERVLQAEPFRLLGNKGSHLSSSTRIQVRLWLAQGNLTEANAWVEQTVFRHTDTNPQQIRGVLTLIRVYLAQQQYNQALATLEEFRAHFDRPENIEDTIYFLSFYATTLHQTERYAQARETVLRLLALTEPEGYLRVYLDMGKPMQRLLQSLLDEPQKHDEAISSPVFAFVSRLLIVFEQEAQKRARKPPAPEQESQEIPSVSLPSTQPIQETLTPQELRVLRLLGSGYSNQEIAQELVVSLNTIKTHVKNLYSKLRVSSRTQALSLARDLQLL